jgi:hypothetical protein
MDEEAWYDEPLRALTHCRGTMPAVDEVYCPALRGQPLATLSPVSSHICTPR